MALPMRAECVTESRMAKEYTLLQTKVFTTRATGRMTGAILLSEVGSCCDNSSSLPCVLWQLACSAGRTEFQSGLSCMHHRISGYGMQSWAIGAFYKGQFKDGKRHGPGECHYQNGQVYRGEWQHNKRTGLGDSFWSDKVCFSWLSTHPSTDQPCLTISAAL
jgi:hypothetical protein